MLPSTLLQGITLGFSAAVSPGPLQAYLLAQATAHGWRKTISAAFGPLLSDGPIILIVVLVLSRVHAWFLQALNIAGGIFLLYLAYGAFRTFRAYTGTSSSPAPERTLLKSALVNFLSPSPWLYWGILAGPILIAAWEQSPANAIAFLLGFYLLLIGGNLALIVLFSTTRRFGPNLTRALNGIAALALLLFALLQLYRGITNT